MRKLNLLVPLALSLISFNFAADGNIIEVEPDSTENDCEVVIYKTASNHSLKALVYRDHRDKTRRKLPAFVYFHGGGWEIGTPEWGRDICHRFATAGFIAISFEYRLEGKHKADALDAIVDAKSAIRWTREHSSDLGIDPNKVVAYGFSAGGHLAACAALIDKFDDPDENLQISSVPNVLIVQSAPIIIFEDNSHFSRIEGISAAKECSPIEYIRPNLPPTILIHGSLDPYTPLWSVVEFEKRMKHFNNRCELHIYEGIKHLDWDPVNNEVFEDIKDFLDSLGYKVDE